MLSIYDYIMILFYFAFTASLGIIFKHFCKGSTDYFAGGRKMNWWLLGASSFIPLIGYILLPVFWFIPAIGAHMIVPDLLEKRFITI